MRKSVTTSKGKKTPMRSSYKSPGQTLSVYEQLTPPPKYYNVRHKGSVNLKNNENTSPINTNELSDLPTYETTWKGQRSVTPEKKSLRNSSSDILRESNQNFNNTDKFNKTNRDLSRLYIRFLFTL